MPNLLGSLFSGLAKQKEEANSTCRPASIRPTLQEQIMQQHSPSVQQQVMQEQLTWAARQEYEARLQAARARRALNVADELSPEEAAKRLNQAAMLLLADDKQSAVKLLMEVDEKFFKNEIALRAHHHLFQVPGYALDAAVWSHSVSTLYGQPVPKDAGPISIMVSDPNV
jgi:hypothetical protein